MQYELAKQNTANLQVIKCILQALEKIAQETRCYMKIWPFHMKNKYIPTGRETNIARHGRLSTNMAGIASDRMALANGLLEDFPTMVGWYLNGSYVPSKRCDTVALPIW